MIGEHLLPFIHETLKCSVSHQPCSSSWLQALRGSEKSKTEVNQKKHKERRGVFAKWSGKGWNCQSECDMCETADGERREKPEREDEGSEWQLFTDKQTHGCRLQGVGKKPRAPSRHEMLLHVTAPAEQPGHLGAGSFSSSLPTGLICRPDSRNIHECQKKGRK